MHVITRQKLTQFWRQHPDATDALKAWFKEAEHARWRSPSDLKARHGTADFLAGNRVVFNIKGGHYRLVVQIHYNTQVVYIRFVGTHQAYDQIDAEKI